MPAIDHAFTGSIPEVYDRYLVPLLSSLMRTTSARHVAIAFCQGTPLRNQIATERLNAATDAAEAALERDSTAGVVRGTMQAHVITIER